MAIIAAAGAVLLTGVVSRSVSGVAVEQRERLGRDIRDLTTREQRSPGDAPVDAVKTVPVQRQVQAMPLARAAAANWKVQIGSFRSETAAAVHLRAATARLPELAAYTPLLEPYGTRVRARIGGIADAQRAQELCSKFVDAGSACYVVPPH